jgi:hypothetical protein
MAKGFISGQKRLGDWGICCFETPCKSMDCLFGASDVKMGL